MKRLLVLGIAAASLAAVGCGGGGGGGGGSSGVAINYEGETSQVVFTEENYQDASEMSADGQMAWDIFGSSAKLPAGVNRFLARTPALAKAAIVPFASGEPVTTEGSCGGTATETYSSGQTSGSVKFVYDQYCDETATGGDVYDGYMKATFKSDVSGTKITNTFVLAMDLTVEEQLLKMQESPPLTLLPTIRGNLTYKIHGVNYDSELHTFDVEDWTFAINMLVADPEMGMEIFFKDLEVTTAFFEDVPIEMSIDGRVYFGTEGYINYTTDEPLDLVNYDFGRLLLDGANGSGVKMELDNGQWTAYLETGEQTPGQYDEGTYTFGDL